MNNISSVSIVLCLMDDIPTTQKTKSHLSDHCLIKAFVVVRDFGVLISECNARKSRKPLSSADFKGPTAGETADPLLAKLLTTAQSTE